MATRRNFIKAGGVLGAGLALGGFNVASGAVKKTAERVKLACIGIGFRGGDIIKSLHQTGLAEVVALCDVDMGAEHTQEIMAKFPNARKFQDFRKMFDTMGSEIEAVSIGTPDFAHFVMARLAMSLGKHVYVEKPLARTFYENELLIETARKNPKIVTQMGNQGHSEGNYFQFKAWKDAGIIKDVTKISAHMNSARRWHGWDPGITRYPEAQAIPQTLDWDLWHLHTTYHDYNEKYHHGNWRCWYDFGMGALGDWGAHILDTAHEFLDLGLPSVIDPVVLESHNDFFFPMSSTLLFRFPERKGMPAVDITWYDGIQNQPPLPDGYGVSALDPNIPVVAGQQIKAAKLNPGKIIYGKDLTFKGGSHGSTLSIIPEAKAKDIQSKLPEVPASPSNHFANFLLACQGKEKTRSPFEISGPLSQVFSLGVLAQRMNRKLLFDRNTKTITNDPFANALLAGPPPRKGWEEYYRV